MMNIDKFELKKGPVSWMVGNRVTPNLLMVLFIVGGLLFSYSIKKEVFPEFERDVVSIRVPYPGSSPEEVEQGIILAIEEAIRGLEGVKEISATASEGSGSVFAELLEGVDRSKVHQDIKQEIDRITTFPKDAEEPEVTLDTHKHEVIDLQLYGDASEWVLKQLAEQLRDELLQNPDITQVELTGARDYEVKVEINQETLRTYGLTLQDLANKISSSSIELPGGYLDTRGGEILLRVKQRMDWAHEFESIPIITTEDGSILYLRDIANVSDDFEDVDKMATHNGKKAIGIEVFRIGKQTPVSVSDAVRDAMPKLESRMPPGVNIAINRDRADIYRQRLELLLKNAFLGFMLVFCLLGLFLEFKLAFWVTMGIPISFLGCFLFLPGMGISINMISMFAFIIALGIVVDDAIIVGENIYEYRNKGMNFIQAAIKGARDVAMPVSFSIITNIVAFIPLYFIPGVIGKIWKVIPMVVITVFAISWIESLFILPAHLAHSKHKPSNRLLNFLNSRQQQFNKSFGRFIEYRFAPFLELCIKFRQITIAIALAILIMILSYVFSGHMGIILMPRIESDRANVTATLPFGSSFDKVKDVLDFIVKNSEEVVKANGGERLCTGIFGSINKNIIEVRIYLTEAGIRPLNTSEVTRLLREKIGQIPGVESLIFESDRGGPGSGAALTVELSHTNIDVLDRASDKLADILSNFSNVKDIDDGYSPGKEQLNFKIKPEGESLGLSAQDIARQVRNSYYGVEALRQQRGRNEIQVRVKLPEYQRSSEYDIEQLLIKTPAGKDVPLMQVAEFERGRSYISIERRNARRTVTVKADIEPISETSQVKIILEKEILPQLSKDYPGLSYGWEGRQADFSESMSSLKSGFIVALLLIYVMLAIPFKSYLQPVIVMLAIPFGIVGAVLGHMIMDYSLSVMSMMGMVALSGVVVNDSLILVEYANRLRNLDSMTPFEAVKNSAIRRFRPVILTTFSTFGGLTPIILETSRQARFMIPMAISLGYGILFATTITLIIVPCLYLLLEDFFKLLKKGNSEKFKG